MLSENLQMLTKTAFKLSDFVYQHCHHMDSFFLDINECALGTHNCHANATCSNTFGGFYCKCKAGFTGDGINSCLRKLH